MVLPLLLIPLIAAAPALSSLTIAIISATGAGGLALGASITLAIDRLFFKPSRQLNASLAVQNETTLKRIDEAQETQNALRVEIQASTDAVNDAMLATTEAISPLRQSTENVLQTSGTLQRTIEDARAVADQFNNGLPVLIEMSEAVSRATTDVTASADAIRGPISDATDNLGVANSSMSTMDSIISDQERSIAELGGQVVMLTSELDKQTKTGLKQREINASFKKENERLYNKSAFFKQTAQQAAPCMDEQARTTAHTSF
jgi:chromosome segregation ATPase